MKPRYTLTLCTVLLILPLTSISFATTYNTPTIDGTVSVGPNDWDQDEFLLDDPNEDSRYHEADIDDIYVTWDAEYFYLGVKTNLAPGGYGNGYVTFIDTDAHAAGITGATDFTGADFYPRRISFDGMGAEIVIGGWSFQSDFDVKYCSNPAGTQLVPGYTSAYNPGMRTFEVKIPWSSIYPQADETVVAWAAMRIVVVSVGGDNSGAYDAAPSSTNDADGDGIPDESDPNTAWDAHTELNESLFFPVDRDGDGVPDQGFPPSGSISGTVTLSDTQDSKTVVTIDAYVGETLYVSAQTGAGGGPYTIGFLPDGTYDLVARASTYRPESRGGIVVEGGGAVEDVDFYLTRVTGAIIGTVAVDGPAMDVKVYAKDTATGEIAGDGEKVIPGGSGDFEILAVEDGSYSFIAEATGYARSDSLVTISGGDTAEVNVILSPARATRYAFVNEFREEILMDSVTVSIPDSGVTYYVGFVLEPRDATGNIALFDSAATEGVTLSATLLDPAVPPRGNVVFADSIGNEFPDDTLPREMFENAVGRFWVLDDSVEVLRIAAIKGDLKGEVELWVKEIEPRKISLTPDVTRIKVGGQEKITIEVQLLDDVGKPIGEPNVQVQLIALQGAPIFEPEADRTDGNGYFTTLVYGFKSGVVQFTASGSFNGKPLLSDTVEVVFDPAAASRIDADLDPAMLGKNEEGNLIYQVVDTYGNPVGQASVEIAVSAYPEALLTSLETPVMTGPDGRATAGLQTGDSYGFVTLEGSAASTQYPVGPATLSIAPGRLISVDEVAPESNPARNSNADADLTNMYAWIGADTLIVALDFSSTWNDMHLMVALEKNRDVAGAEQDPFEFPIHYRHPYRPDYVFTYKYSGQDYSDLRRWTNGWEFWYLDTETWSSQEADGKNALGMIQRTASQVWFKFPLAAIGEVSDGDTLSLESYVTQEPFETKYRALDSSPDDATHDMEPETGDWWDTATAPVTLSKYALFIVEAGAAAPSLSDPKTSRASASPGDKVIFSVSVTDAGGGIGDVYADLTAAGGGEVTWLFDDGTHGDTQAGDGVYSAEFEIPRGVTQGPRNIWFIGRDGLNLSVSKVSTSLEIVTLPEAFITIVDPVGDDHGPDSTDTEGNSIEGLYYEYPTNGVFTPGVFDIHRVDFIIDGTLLVIRLKVGDIPSSRAVGWGATYPGSECKNPYKADLNLHKVDVYIDSEEGVGATAGLVDRYFDIARNDAWDYAIAIEGWWKGLVKSNGKNSTADWTIDKQSMSFCTDHLENTIDIEIELSALDLIAEGQIPTETELEVIRIEISKWDFIVTMGSHDGESRDENFGGSRWVVKGQSEWQFWNGADTEDGRERDANIIDVATRYGSGKDPGRTQTEMLNYKSDLAERRFERNASACILEASDSKDISPPIVTPFARDGYAHRPWRILQYSPASFYTRVEDEEGVVERVEFHWRPQGQQRWNISPMGKIVEEYWVVDMDPDELAQVARAVEFPDGSVRMPFEAEIYAWDDSGNRGKSEFFTFGVVEERLPYQLKKVQPGQVAITYDCTFIEMPETPLAAGYDSLFIKITPLASSGADAVDLANLRPSMDYLEVARHLEIIRYDDHAPTVLEDLAAGPVIALHYPTYAEGGRLDEKRIGLFHYNDLTQRWIRISGLVNDLGNAVRAQMRTVGTFALFADSDISYDPGKGLSGTSVEPNPFSPNGDGLYDETRISFYLSREVNWITIEIYDISGEEVRTISWQEGVASPGRNEVQIIWDGKDDNGKVVPYGIYVMRVEANFKIEPRYERENIAVVVIK